MKKVSKILTATISCLMATTLVLPVSAEGEVEKKESVYTVLNSDGSVSSITVSDTLHSDSGFSNYQDKSDLQNVENLKSSDPVSSSNGNLIWNTDATDIYYQGTSNKELPLTVKITYTLDGNAVSADDLVGKSGHLKINIKLSNSSKQSYVVNGKTYNLVTPFVTGIGGMFDDDVFSNVTIDNGKVTSDSSHSIVVGVIVPGLKSGLSQVLDSDLMHRLDDYLADEVNIEADVTDFESPTLMMAAATSTDAIKDEFDDIDEFSSIFDKLDDLKEATNELIDGTNSLYDGAVKLNDGVATLKDGANTLSNGASSLYDGANTLSNGANTLYAGLNKLSGNSESLRNGMSTLANKVLDSANEDLEEAGFPKVTWDDVTKCATTETCVLDSYGDMEVTDAQRKQAKAEIMAEAKVSDESIINTLIYMAAINPDSSKTFKEKLTIAGEELTAASALSTTDEYINAEKFVAQVAAESYNFSEDGTDQFTNVLKAIRTLTAQYPSDDVLNDTYKTVLNKIIAAVKDSASKDIDENTAAQILAYACNNSVDTSNPLSDTNIGNAIKKMSEDTSYSCEDPQNDPKVSATIKVAYQTTVSQTSLKDIYSTTISKIVETLKASGKTEKEANESAPLVFAYAVTKHNGTYDGSTTYFTDYSADLVTMQTANDAKNCANSKDGLGVVKSALNSVVQSTVKSEMKVAKDSLKDLYTLVSGLNEYTAGVDSAFAGSKTLANGASQVANGSKQIKDGASSLLSGVGTLKDGSQQLADGAKTLKEGMQKYNDEAISKLTNNSRISSIEQASDLLEAISKDENNYNNFSGISDGTDGSIKFVFKINGVKKAKSDDTSSETTTKVSFWQRILNLFKF